ncbi:MAG: DUF1573 domain-containing protein [Bacteroidia bacterium]
MSTIKQYLLQAVFTLAIGLSGSVASSAQVTVQPGSTVFIQDTIIEFGIISLQDSLVKTVSFKNTGKVDFQWIDAVSECGCATIILPKKPVKPGRKGEFQIVFKSPYIGTIEKKITMVSTAGIHYLTYHAYVKE